MEKNQLFDNIFIFDLVFFFLPLKMFECLSNKCHLTFCAGVLYAECNDPKPLRMDPKLPIKKYLFALQLTCDN